MLSAPGAEAGRLDASRIGRHTRSRRREREWLPSGVTRCSPSGESDISVYGPTRPSVVILVSASLPACFTNKLIFVVFPFLMFPCNQLGQGLAGNVDALARSVLVYERHFRVFGGEDNFATLRRGNE